MADDPAQVAQELERARSLAQRGTLLAGANTVTVAVLLQSLATLISPGLATHAGAKFTLLIALLCFAGLRSPRQLQLPPPQQVLAP
jgi:hypothetical protein